MRVLFRPFSSGFLLPLAALLLLCIPPAQGQNRDSLWRIWQDTKKPDATRLNALDTIAFSYVRKQPDSALYLARIQYDYANKKGNQKSMARAFFIQGAALKAKKEFDKASEAYQQGIRIAEASGHKQIAAQSYRSLSILYKERGNLSLARDYGNHALELATAVNDKELIASTLNTIGNVYIQIGEIDSALSYHLRSLDLRRELNDKEGMSIVLTNLGIEYKQKGNIVKALESYNHALKLEEKMENKSGIATVLVNLGTLYLDQGNPAKALEHYNRGGEYFEELGEKTNMGLVQLCLGDAYLKLKDTSKALHYLSQGLETFTALGFQSKVAFTFEKIGEVYRSKKEFDRALEYYNRSYQIYKTIGDKIGVATAYGCMAEVYLTQGDFSSAIYNAGKALDIAQSIGYPNIEKGMSFILYKSYKATGKPAQALEMYEVYISRRDTLASEENQRELIRNEYEYEYEKQALADSLKFAQQAAIKDLEIENHEANAGRQRIALASSIGGLILIIALAFVFYRGKKKSDTLLLNILPSETAKELKQKGYADARHYEQATVLFTDFKDFTQLTERLDPDMLVAAIDECFRAFDRIVEKHGIEKIKTIGDSYMAAGGLPIADKTNAERVVKAALEMRDFIIGFKEKRNEEGFEMRIGIHTGPVIAGIVGVKKFQYDIWGDTVNTASRMESSGEPGKVNISGATYELVKDKFHFTCRGRIEAKNKGEVDMYFVDWKREGQDVVVEQAEEVVPHHPSL